MAVPLAMMGRTILPALGSSLNRSTLALRCTGMQPARMVYFPFSKSSHRTEFLLTSTYISRNMSSVRALKNEEEAAAAVAVTADTGAPTVFDKIVKKEIPATIVYEDEHVLAFRDINPQAPLHIVVIPKIRDGLTQLSKAEPRHKDILGHLLYSTTLIAKQEGIEDYRIVINNGPTACQSVYHIHLHIIGGRQLNWPPG